MDLRTPDKDVRGQIDAAKSYLSAEGFTEITDSPQLQRETFEDFHAIHAAFEGHRKTLLLSYTWLSDHQPHVVSAWLTEKEVGGNLKGERSARVSASGLIGYEMDYPQ